MSTSNRVAIVTGGSGGIGRQVVRRLTADGYHVAVNFAGNAEQAEAVAAEATEGGAKAIAVQADVADESAVKALFEETERAFGAVDVLVNAAGQMALAPLAELDLDELDRLHRTNIRGTFVTNQQAVLRLREGGSIVNFSTSIVGLALPTYAAYSASKGAVEAMTLIVARELRGKDITINAVAPGPTATPLFLDGKSQELIDQMASQPPLQRLGTPEDAAEVVAFLAGPQGRWVNGQVIRANGGIV